MGITASSKGGSNFEPVPAGMHRAVCYAIYDIGYQHNTKFNKWQHEVVICWEIPSLRIDIEKDGQTLDLPRVISKKYTLSLGEKSHLYNDLVMWRGKAFTKEELTGFDITKLLSVNCQLQVIHNAVGDKTYANIKAIVPVPRNEWVPPENPAHYFSLEDGTEPPEQTPKWILDLIDKSKEMQEIDSMPDDPGGPVPPIDAYDDPPPEDDQDLPF